MNNIILNSTTRSQIEGVIQMLPHSVLILGTPGSGKETLAKYLTAKVLNTDIDTIESNTNVLTVKPIKKSISIDEIRTLQNFAKLKTIGKNLIRRVALVISADQMSIEAQNAFLKLLEEPPEDTMFILTSADKNKLLPTVISRVQTINYYPIDNNLLKKHFAEQGFDNNHVEKALMFSNGLVGLTSDILNETYSAHQQNIDFAKLLITSNSYNRQVLLSKILDDKNNIDGVLLSMKRIFQNMLESSINIEDTANTRRYSNSINHIIMAEDYLEKNVQVKLVISNLLLNI